MMLPTFDNTRLNTTLPYTLEAVRGRRTAEARFVSPTTDQVLVKVPAQLSKTEQHRIAQQLVERLYRQRQRSKQRQVLCEAQLQAEPLITIGSLEALQAFVAQVNAETFQYPFDITVKLGQAKRTRLAQINIRLRQMTVSAYCLTEAPERGLRYLIVHELAHLCFANHSRAFWALVAQYEPRYRHYHTLMTHHHQQQVEA